MTGSVRSPPQHDGDLADVLSFLRADPGEVYAALHADARERVDRWRREYRRDVSAAVGPDVDVERLLKRVTVNQYRAWCATDVIIRRSLRCDDDDINSDDTDALHAVAEEQVRLSRDRRAGLRRLGVYPDDGGETQSA